MDRVTEAVLNNIASWPKWKQEQLGSVFGNGESWAEPEADYQARGADPMSKNFYTTNLSEIKCPYCGCVEIDPCEYDESDSEWECGRCDKVSDLSVDMTVKYSTTKRDEEEDDEDDEEE